MQRMIVNAWILLGVLLTGACEMSEGEDAEVTSEIAAVADVDRPPSFSPEEIPLYANNVGTHALVAGDKIWRNTSDGSSFFVLEGDQAFEKTGNDILLDTYEFKYQSKNYAYIYDASRNLNFALGVYRQGRHAQGWKWNTTTKEWVRWRRFVYNVILGNACDSDVTPPTASHQPCRVSGSKLICDKLYTPSDTLEDYSVYVKPLYNIADNCTSTEEIAFVQTPPPGTVYNTGGTVSVTFKIYDNHGNVLDFYAFVEILGW